MATFDDLPMRLDAGGAIIQLTRKPDRDWAERLPGGIEVQVTSGSSGIRVEGLDLGNGLDDLSALAREIANQALDLMAVRSVGTYALARSIIDLSLEEDQPDRACQLPQS